MAEVRVNDYGVDLARVRPGAKVHVASYDGDQATAEVVRMDNRTVGVIEVHPEHQQGEPYRTLFSAHNITEVIEDGPDESR